MLNRRIFLKTSTAALTAIASINPSLAKTISEKRQHTIDTVIYDERFVDSLAFADDAAKQGAVTVGIGEDLNEGCYLELLEKFKSQNSVVAGVTTEPVASYIKAIARDSAYQQIHKSEFLPQQLNEQSLVTWVFAPIRA